MEKIKDRVYTGERALFFGKDLQLTGCVFEDGESPLKESENIRLIDSTFCWKYPLWYSENVEVEHCTLKETARSGVWYTKNIRVRDSLVEAPKTFRRATDVYLKNVAMPHAQETLWHCRGVRIEDVKAVGDYFAMDCEDVAVDRFHLDGNYCFDGAKNVTVKDSFLNSKDSFWNTTDVVVEDSTIIGEYLGWNSRNLTLKNCTIESLQGMCYIENLRLINCRLNNTTLAFEYCTVDADIDGGVDSVLNPTSGVIRANHIGELILQPDRVDPTRTKIVIKE
ncbi:MAG: DUF3737 family protein [Clostridia bacterium]|nr:DUF3737 family protein [Clostridia bacterium]